MMPAGRLGRRPAWSGPAGHGPVCDRRTRSRSRSRVNRPPVPGSPAWGPGPTSEPSKLAKSELLTRTVTATVPEPNLSDWHSEAPTQAQARGRSEAQGQDTARLLPNPEFCVTTGFDRVPAQLRVLD